MKGQRCALVEHCENENWHAAMELYNQALYFAENDSEYMGILLVMQGFCFCNMRMYDTGITGMNHCSISHLMRVHLILQFVCGKISKSICKKQEILHLSTFKLIENHSPKKRNSNQR